MSIEAMKLALEALNQIKNANIKGLYLLPDFHNAITALHQAIKDEEEAFRPDYDTNAVLLERIRELEAQLKKEPVGEVLNIQWMSNTGGWLIGFHSKQRLYKGDKLYVEPMSIKPEHVDGVDIEPVAWMNPYGGQTLTAHAMENFACGIEKQTYTIPLYTAQPKREWQGLTDDEIRKLLGSPKLAEYARIVYVEFARAIEQRLKDKNND